MNTATNTSKHIYAYQLGGDMTKMGKINLYIYRPIYLTGLFNYEPLSIPQSLYNQAAKSSATILSHSTIATTAYSQVSFMHCNTDTSDFIC